MKTKQKCKDCGRYLEDKIIKRMNILKVGMHCYKCGSKHIKIGGRYNTIKEGIKRRWVCCHCNYHFIKRTISYKKKISALVIRKILRCSLKHKGYFNKYDNSKKTAYSTRELAEMFNISKSGIWQLLKSNET